MGVLSTTWRTSPVVKPDIYAPKYALQIKHEWIQFYNILIVQMNDAAIYCHESTEYKVIEDSE